MITLWPHEALDPPQELLGLHVIFAMLLFILYIPNLWVSQLHRTSIPVVSPASETFRKCMRMHMKAVPRMAENPWKDKTSSHLTTPLTTNDDMIPMRNTDIISTTKTDTNTNTNNKLM